MKILFVGCGIAAATIGIAFTLKDLDKDDPPMRHELPPWLVELGDAETDGDLDGIKDEDEASFGYDPNNRDSDGDGTIDGLEDFDNDGWNNREEYRMGTDPLDPESVPAEVIGDPDDFDY